MSAGDADSYSAPRKLTAHFSMIIEGVASTFKKQTSALPAEPTKDRPPRRIESIERGRGINDGAARVNKLQHDATAASEAKVDASPRAAAGSGVIMTTAAALLTCAWVVATASLVRQLVRARASR